MAARVLAALRPMPFRGDVLAAGVVVLTTLVAVLEVRFAAAWDAGVHLAYAGIATAAVGTMAFESPREAAAPRAYQSVLYLATLALALMTLADLSQVLGAERAFGAPGTTTWVFATLAALALWLAATRNSAVCTLAGSVAAGVALLALVQWAFAPEGLQTSRWVLFGLTAAFGLAAVAQRDRRLRHGVALVDAAGLACAALGATLALDQVFMVVLAGVPQPVGRAPWGWELLLLAAGFGLIAYASVDREAGPAYLGVLNLVLFLLVAAAPGRDGASLVGWPLFLMVAAGALLTVALRPTTPAPPPPDADAPPAPTTPFGAQ